MTEPGDGFFKAEDFIDDIEVDRSGCEAGPAWMTALNHSEAQAIADKVNRILRERGRVVYRHKGQMFKEMWGEHPGIEGWEKGVVDAALLIDARKVNEG